MHTPEDGLWLCDYPQPDADSNISVGEIAEYGNASQLAIISYANGFYLSRQAQKILQDQQGIEVKVIDIRWLAPLNEQAIIDSVAHCENVLIVDECRDTGSQSEALMTLLVEKAAHKPNLKRVVAEDCFIPLGKAATVTLPSCDSIVSAAKELIANPL